MPDIQLVVVDGPLQGKEFEIAGSSVIGRDPSSGIVLDDPEASRRHASLSAEEDGLTVEDLGSTNGTYVAGERLTASRRVGNGERIRIGTSVMEVRVEAPAPPPEAEDPQATRIGGMAVPDAPPPPEPEPEPAAYEPPAPPPPLAPEPVAYEPPAPPEPEPYEPPAPPEPPAYDPPPAPEPVAYEPPAPPEPPAYEPPAPPEPPAYDPPPVPEPVAYEPPAPPEPEPYEPEPYEPPADDGATEMRPVPTGFDAPGDVAPPPPPGAGFDPGAPPPAPGPPPEPHYAEGPQASAPPPPPPPPPPGGFAGDPGPPPPPPGYGAPGAPPQGPPGYAPGGPMVGPGGFAPQGPMPPRNPNVEWLLCIFVPLYSLYFIHRSSKEMEAWSNGRIQYNPTSTLLAFTLGAFIFVPPFVAIASYCGRVREAQRMAGLPQDVSFWGFIGRAFLISYVYNWLQERFNAIGTRPPQY